MRRPRLSGLDNCVFEIDIMDANISKSPPLVVGNNDLGKLQNRLPPSFLKFIQRIANGLHIELANSLTVLPVGPGPSDYGTNVLALTTEMLSDDVFPSKDFVFFAMSGGGELFAFYTAKKFRNGEYPIVWFTPGSIDSNPFVLINTGFDKFLTMQYYILKATEYGDTFATYEEALKASTDKNKMEQDDRNWQNFQNKLYDTFDSTIPKPNHDLYKSTKTLKELNETIEQTMQNSL
jgi:hypothetical protein